MTLEERVKAGRERQKRWRERRKAEGKKVLTVTLSKEAKELLEKEQDRTGDTLSYIIDRALIGDKKPERHDVLYSRPEELLDGQGKEITSVLTGATGKLRDESPGLASTDEKWLFFMKSAIDSFSLYDSELNLIAINEAGLRLLPNGNTYESVMRKNISELIPDYYNVPERYEKLKEVIRTGEPYFVDEIIPSSKEGEQSYINVRAFKVGNGLGIIIAVITERKRAEEALRRQQEYLDRVVEQRTVKLEEANAALKVLLKRREEDKEELEEKMLFSVKELVDPYVEKLRNSSLDESQKAYTDIIKSNLNDIVSPLARRMSMEHLRLTHTEIQVANLVKQGRITKEIAELLHLSPRTVESYRDNIRKKLGIKNKKVNLRTYLLSFQ
jgi:DNA-binding CsgD family transcriptional regulator/PAS domain-containing protein